jgi:hypothetical protein
VKRERAISPPATNQPVANDRQWTLWRPRRRPALLLLTVLMLLAWIGFLSWMAIGG